MSRFLWFTVYGLWSEINMDDDDYDTWHGHNIKIKVNNNLVKCSD